MQSLKLVATKSLIQSSKNLSNSFKNYLDKLDKFIDYWLRLLVSTNLNDCMIPPDSQQAMLNVLLIIIF